MLTYATLDDWGRVKRVGDTQLENNREIILDYLRKASATIDTITLRSFFPYFETREYSVPSGYVDLSNRAFLWADLDLGADLLEVDAVTTGPADDLQTLTAAEYHLLDFNHWPKYGIRLVWPRTWAGNYGATGLLRYRYPAIHVAGWWGYHDHYERSGFVNTRQVLGVGGLTDAATEIVLASVTGQAADLAPAFEVGNLLRIGAELLPITQVTVTTTAPITHTLGVARGFNGTVASAHAEGAAISRWSVPFTIREACLTIAKMLRESDEAKGGRIGVSEMSQGVEVGIPKDTYYVLKRLRRDA